MTAIPVSVTTVTAALRTLAFMALLVGIAFAAPVQAGEAAAFDAAAFSEAKKAGKSVLVDVHAPWCSTCKAQKAALDELTARPEYKDIVLFRIDFDSQKDDWKALGAQSRSTLIAFKGETETGRIVGDTKKDSIEALLKSAL